MPWGSGKRPSGSEREEHRGVDREGPDENYCALGFLCSCTRIGAYASTSLRGISKKSDFPACSSAATSLSLGPLGSLGR